MANKPWLNKHFLYRNYSTNRDYPPKRKKHWRWGSFPATESFHFDNLRPWGPRKRTKVGDPCAGRVLFPLGTQRTIECGDTEFNIHPTGNVGPVSFVLADSTLPDVEVGGNGDVVILPCQFNDESFITFFTCDSCGCGTYTVWFEDCDAECDPVASISCDGGACDETTTSTTKQYYLNNAIGEVLWSVTGEDASIDGTGLLTTGASACGSLVITAENCCGTFTQGVRVTDAGSWQDETVICDNFQAGHQLYCDYADEQYRYKIWGDCGADGFICSSQSWWCSPYDIADPCDCIGGGCIDCGALGGTHVCASKVSRFEWKCVP